MADGIAFGLAVETKSAHWCKRVGYLAHQGGVNKKWGRIRIRVVSARLHIQGKLSDSESLVIDHTCGSS